MAGLLNVNEEAAVIVDAHTLELLEFDKVRELLSGYAACSLGKELTRQLEPGTDAEKLRLRDCPGHRNGRCHRYGPPAALRRTA